MRRFGFTAVIFQYNVITKCLGDRPVTEKKKPVRRNILTLRASRRAYIKQHETDLFFGEDFQCPGCSFEDSFPAEPDYLISKAP